MKKIILSFAFAAMFSAQFFAQASRNLYVRFDQSLVFSGITDYKKAIKDQCTEFNALMESQGLTYQLKPVFSEAQVTKLRAQAQLKNNPTTAIDNLGRTFQVMVSNENDAILDEVAEKLVTLDKVQAHYFSSKKAVKAPVDIPPVTTDFYSEQTYVGPDPGVNIEYAWSQGVTGSNIYVRDVEYGINLDHEELSEKNISVFEQISPDASTDYTEHGTAAMGIIISDEGFYGIVGMQYGIEEMILFPEWTVNGYDRLNAVTSAVAASQIGDVIMYEMQTGGLNDEYVLAEYDYLIWEATKAATDAGIVVVAAAGNGDQDLDNSFYDEYNGRENSGAIIVGAGSDDTDHTRLSFSTYGSRVNVQAWGQNVIAPGYGDSYQFGSDFNQNYTYFSGTSSATPIVTSCAIALQSYYFELTGDYLTSQQIREILIETGIPQGLPATKHIGPLPNVQEAMTAVNVLSVNKLKENEFRLFPNPVKDQLTVSTKDYAEAKKIAITNTLGELVYADTMNSNITLDLSSFEAGVYFLTIQSENATSTQKFVKK